LCNERVINLPRIPRLLAVQDFQLAPLARSARRAESHRCRGDHPGVAAVETHQVFCLGAALRGDYVLGDTAYDCDYRHELLRAGKYDFGPSDEPVLESGDRISIATHGMTNSHIDAYCHVGHHGRTFNGERFEDVVTLQGGATRYTMPALGGFATRAWFVDVPASRGLTHLEPSDPVTPEDLRSFASRVQPGDALVVRTGRFSAPLLLPRRPKTRTVTGAGSTSSAST
jgi:hypothetical protein